MPAIVGGVEFRCHGRQQVHVMSMIWPSSARNYAESSLEYVMIIKLRLIRYAFYLFVKDFLQPA